MLLIALCSFLWLFSSASSFSPESSSSLALSSASSRASASTQKTSATECSKPSATSSAPTHLPSLDSSSRSKTHSSILSGFASRPIAFARTASNGSSSFLTQEPFVFITSTDAGAPIRAELDGGGGSRTWLDVQVFVEDPAGGLTQVHNERIYVGDTPVEWIGPIVEEQWRGRMVRVRTTDVGTGATVADDMSKVRRS
ncbi:MAG: hypothetical protein JNM84_19740 [Planctomycetes bacterium]|nr:hypothetical protein [Planctomycetota bacterium]